jgi:hypothetical protein
LLVDDACQHPAGAPVGFAHHAARTKLLPEPADAALRGLGGQVPHFPAPARDGELGGWMCSSSDILQRQLARFTSGWPRRAQHHGLVAGQLRAADIVRQRQQDIDRRVQRAGRQFTFQFAAADLRYSA